MGNEIVYWDIPDQEFMEKTFKIVRNVSKTVLHMKLEYHEKLTENFVRQGTERLWVELCQINTGYRYLVHMVGFGGRK